MELSFYKKIILFRNMTEQEIDDTLKCLNPYKRSYHKGETIFHAGSSTTFIGLIYKGSVLVERNDFWGNRTVLTNFKENDFFGEAYAMNPQTVIPVDIVATEDSSIIFLEIGKFTARCSSAPHVTHKLLENLLQISLQKNILLSNRSFLLATRTMRGKILAYLNTVAVQSKSQDFAIPFDRQQLADFLNIERTALSKELSKMKSEGLITYRKNHFTLLDVDYEE